MTGKVDSIFATFIRRSTFIPCREFGLSTDFLELNRRVEPTPQVPDELDCELQVDDKTIDLVFKDDKVSYKSFKQLDESIEADSTLEDIKNETKNLDVTLCDGEKSTVYDKVVDTKQETNSFTANEDGDDVIDSNAYMEDQLCTGGDFGTDSDFELSASSSSGRGGGGGGRAKKTKLRQKVLTQQTKCTSERKMSGKDGRDDHVYLERVRVLREVLPTQFRTCFLCSIGSEFLALVKCTVCNNVFHPVCLKEADISETPDCCKDYPKSVVAQSKEVCALKPYLKRGRDTFKTNFVPTAKRYLTKKQLQNILDEDPNICYVEVPANIKRQYNQPSSTGCQLYCKDKAHLKTEALELKRKMCDDQSNTESLNWNARNSVNISQNTVMAALLLVDCNFNEISQRIDICADHNVFTIGTNQCNCDLKLPELKKCQFVSSIHCRVYFVQEEGQFELLNYSCHGTMVDNIVYSYQSAAEDSEKERSTLGGGFKCDCDHSLSSRSAAELKNDANARQWEGAAVLYHGSTIRIGCLDFVFAVA